MSFNKVILMGNLTRDPELRYSQSNTAICKAGLAVDAGYGERKSTTFVDVTMFGKRAEAFEKFHKKGSSVLVDGELRLDTWDDKNTGQKRTKLYVVAEGWEFTGNKKEQRESEQPEAAGWDNDDPFA